MDRMDAKLSTLPSIALARALEARLPGGTAGGREAAVGPFDPSTWVSPKPAAEKLRSQDLDRALDADAQSDAFVAGTLNMVAYGREQSTALVAHSIDHDTVTERRADAVGAHP